MPITIIFINGSGLADKCIKWLLHMRLYWFERQISPKFDRGLSLKIDRLHNTLEKISSNPKLENGSLAGVIKAISKKATAAALQWFQPEAILRAVLWTTKKRLNGSGKY